MNRDARKQIYLDTLEKCRSYSLPHSYSPSVKYNFNSSFKNIDIPYPNRIKPEVSVFNEDVITTILRTKRTSKVLVLNLASAKHFGGGVANGALAQEEELFRKTDYGCHGGKELYPLSIGEFVVTPNVTVIKNADYSDLPVQEFRTVDMIALPGLNLPEGTKTLSKTEYAFTKLKIESLFKFAYTFGYQELVLGALGCGVFHNPPEIIATIFHEEIQKYAGAFQSIKFAVLSKTDSNFDVFQRILQE